MEIFNASVLLGLLILFLSLSLKFLLEEKRNKSLPPGTSGYPMIGESIAFLSTGWKGHPENFIHDRLAKYSSKIFRTNLFGYPTLVFCGAEANKLLFSNENKLVELWWPKTLDRIFHSRSDSTAQEEQIRFRKVLQGFLKPEALRRYVGVMDSMSCAFFEAHWENKDQVLVFPLAKRYTFLIACRLLLSVEDLEAVAEHQEAFDVLNKGVLSMPIDLPGTQFNRAIKTSKYLRMKIAGMVKQRKIDLEVGKASQTQDILSHMILTCDENGKYMPEEDIGQWIVGLIVAAYDTESSAITSVVRYLAELPDIYQNVYNEQMKIANSKGDGELLNWEDIKKMKYSWNVACEVLRLSPPLQGTFREAIADFKYNGYSIPKNWKIYWSTHATQRNPEYFPEPQKFDPSRFEGSGPAPYTFVPFGGGPRICSGREYARLEILVFMHNLVKRFKLEKVIHDEKIIVNPMPSPEKGMPMRLIPHKKD